ncbi:16S rRNA (uracil(1498)-N(3))-methyltransferase [Halosquirtibacter laminarini]|uniref:16S rRNA (Uracil(1498)-N(3))-methyltransferase n=1 Tax=Halosquirtibacter laminarini TaxID=3374600 RepID=A0AC61NC32_9BACT|nr:16S rRNA (uracil(1498)-N(3))-methyltransferase [Prolixibacteraceae bacterium]
MHLFYTPDLVEDRYVLDEVESKHCVKVLRLKEEDIIELVDGKGVFAKARIINAHPKACALEIIQKTEEFQKRNYHIEIAVAPTKNIDRIEWFIEKATEIGVDRITPVLCSRSERKMVKIQRLTKVAISAMKQSIKAYLPQVDDLISFKEVVLEPFDGEKFIAHCEEDAPRVSFVRTVLSDRVKVLIGPEGDFTSKEVEFAKLHGYREISLGEQRLRTETAALMSVSSFAVLQDLKSTKN